MQVATQLVEVISELNRCTRLWDTSLKRAIVQECASAKTTYRTLHNLRQYPQHHGVLADLPGSSEMLQTALMNKLLTSLQNLTSSLEKADGTLHTAAKSGNKGIGIYHTYWEKFEPDDSKLPLAEDLWNYMTEVPTLCRSLLAQCKGSVEQLKVSLDESQGYNLDAFSEICDSLTQSVTNIPWPEEPVWP
eukprot:TRINITY_DN10184_c0_g1_i1.p1 TRINITY_DN10184_c0_g1~~TRINITY_DN10184_c0_g1_i1.p1  ORF type:complete len:190 (+),score=4.23 TRINITY_DN10184_c0_g1_i1:18-587(+)